MDALRRTRWRAWDKFIHVEHNLRTCLRRSKFGLLHVLL